MNKLENLRETFSWENLFHTWAFWLSDFKVQLKTVSGNKGAVYFKSKYLIGTKRRNIL